VFLTEVALRCEAAADPGFSKEGDYVDSIRGSEGGANSGVQV